MKQLPEQKISNINQYFQKNEIKKKTKIESRKISRYNQEKYQEKNQEKISLFFLEIVMSKTNQYLRASNS